MTKTLATALPLTLTLITLLTGCGGDNDDPAPPSTQTATTAPNPTAALKREARSALSENRRLSIYVLWNNKIPAWSTHSTRGPALDSLRTAAQNRRKRGIRVYVLKDERRVVSLQLDPSYLRATATVVDEQRLQPSRRNGSPLGRVVSLNEKARYVLRRIGRTNRFVVWNVVVQ